MKKRRTPIALIGTALLIAFGLLQMGAGIGSVVSPWHLHGGTVGWLVNAKAVYAANWQAALFPSVLAVLSFALGIALIGSGVACGAAGLSAIGWSRRGTRSRSGQLFLVGALVVTLIALVSSAAWLTLVRPNLKAAAARKAIEKLDGAVVVEGWVRKRIVQVSFSRVTDAGLKELKDLKSLQTLYVNGTPWAANPPSQVTDAGLKELKDLKSLRTLYLNGTRVTDGGLKELKELGSLQTLNLNGTQVTDAALKELNELRSLEVLALDKTAVTDAGLKELKELRSLGMLDLENTRVTDAGLKELKDIKSLVTVYLHGTQVTPAGVQELKAARPGLQITAKVR